MVKICAVEEHSRAYGAGIRPGDVLRSINGHEIRDVLDYRFYLTERTVELCCLRGGDEAQVYVAVIHKKEYDDIGLDFETPLMDKKQRCANQCIFCFIDQLPQGLRPSLYFKDDDARLSFLHGNYITLTNLTDRDIDRILEMHISPVNLSIHTTNPELRVKMMKNKRAGEVLSYIRRLADGGISLCGQIVLCKNVNDGAELDRTMRDLTAYLPAMTSVSIVPSGLTRFREGLYPLEPFDAAESAAVIAQVEAFAEACLEKYGSRIFYCSDEWYVKAGLPIHDEAYFEGYAQIENGVGMLTSLREELACERDFLRQEAPVEQGHPARRISLCTGVAAYPFICEEVAKITAEYPWVQVRVYEIVNHFFGEQITVAGLLTGRDMAEQLAGQELGEELLIPAATLRAEGDLFLCGMTPAELSEKLGVPVRPVDSDGAEFLHAVLGE